MTKIQIYKNRANKWQFRIVAANGNKLILSGDGYSNRLDCVKLAHTHSKPYYPRYKVYLNGVETTWTKLLKKRTKS